MASRGQKKAGRIFRPAFCDMGGEIVVLGLELPAYDTAKAQQARAHEQERCRFGGIASSVRLSADAIPVDRFIAVFTEDTIVNEIPSARVQNLAAVVRRKWNAICQERNHGDVCSTSGRVARICG